MKKLLLKGSKGSVIANALFDSGASHSFIKREIAEKIEVLTKMPEPMDFSTAEEGAKVFATHCISIHFYINNDRFGEMFYVIDNLAEDVIIGAKTMQAYHFKLDFEKKEITYPPEVTRFQII